MSAAKCLADVDVVVLAGGLGTRLSSELPDVPKVLAPVAGRPFLGHLLEQVRSFGARHVILALGHLAHKIEDYIRTWDGSGLTIAAHVEHEPRGTGGALREALGLVNTNTVMAVNGDAFTDADLCAFVAFHREKRARASLLLTFIPDVGRYGLVDVDEDGAVRSFTEKPDPAAIEHGGYINAGVYVMEQDVIADIPAGETVSVEREVFPGLCGNGLYAMRGRYPFIDIGTPESYAAAESFFAELGTRLPQPVGSGLRIRRSA